MWFTFKVHGVTIRVGLAHIGMAVLGAVIALLGQYALMNL